VACVCPDFQGSKQLFFGFYWYLFRQTLFTNLTHAKKAKQFVHAIPAHILHTEDVQSIIEYFVGVDKAQDEKMFS